MFGQDRQQLRLFYQQSWQKFQSQQPLTDLESQVVQVIHEHPEYHAVLLTNDGQEKDWLPEMGETNPFLHCGLHLALREQVATDRPSGIRAIYQQLIAQQSPHEVEHRMIDHLAEAIWSAQRNRSMPDESAYLTALQALLQH